MTWTPEDQANADADHAASAPAAAQGTQFESLVDPADPDWDLYQTDDPSWFLKTAGRTIRNYCGWHIYPNVQTTQHKLMCGAHGIITLPTRRITQVDSLFINQSGVNGAAHFLDPSQYVWHEAGWIERFTSTDWAFGAYYYGNDPYYLPVYNQGQATCTFWHGYNALPEDIKEVAFELAEQAMTLRAGNVKMLEAPGGYRTQFSQNPGLSLNEEQMDRLANYRRPAVA